ncbi:MAG: 5'-nucleotidase C-terminal domain-containing protein [Deltaproteobacteria bacterium]|nr:5'-nucleotidase C-terminal domain-containing protein [Deltaproteobacteria bacterium]MBW1736065.1 5'-nucleotidase C-terminal domain-containing protein [Deltaproteobacteria bacterium]MBW1908099.1 5'-nucleotidase C-terminal domain-containing protein [Deltaproteobacteria bacterium]MBW2032164.1 5'-nucleotidase C-terminal domain-containing protein [Deltaproteobacteria bacterium]MBW2113248.1 5'-nucleotidase C-terminal domain-containing protein [Deltaproteobacteria bacterium]
MLLVLSLSCGTTKELKLDRESFVYKLVIVHTNDTHGHPLKFFKHPAPDVGGLPARASLVRQIRKENENVLVLDAGDLNTGRAESTFFKAKPDIDGYNCIGYDAMVLGNHEFDNSTEVLEWQMSLAHFPFLSANVKTKDGEYLTRRYIIKRFHGFKVAIFGLTTRETILIGNPKYIKDLIFEDEIEVARKLVPELKKKADLVIALVHMGIYQSFREGSRRLASEVDGIDLIVDGHTHTKLDSPIFVKKFGSDHKTLIVQAWKWGLVVGRVDLWIRNKRVIDYKFEAIPINLKTEEKRPDGSKVYSFIDKEIEEDKGLLYILQPYIDKVASRLSEVIGHAEEIFYYKDTKNKETALGNIIADSMLWYTKKMGVDFAIQNGGGIRADLPKGRITMKSIYEVLPFDNSVVVLTLNGSDVQSLFDYIATISFGKGAFPQVSEGLSFTINRVTGKCQDILINGQPIYQFRNYRIATNSYLAGGGDGFKMFLNAIYSYDTSKFQKDVFIEYIKHLGGSIRPKIRGRIDLITEFYMPWLKLAA